MYKGFLYETNEVTRPHYVVQLIKDKVFKFVKHIYTKHNNFINTYKDSEEEVSHWMADRVRNIGNEYYGVKFKLSEIFGNDIGAMITKLSSEEDGGALEFIKLLSRGSLVLAEAEVVGRSICVKNSLRNDRCDTGGINEDGDILLPFFTHGVYDLIQFPDGIDEYDSILQHELTHLYDIVINKDFGSSVNSSVEEYYTNGLEVNAFTSQFFDFIESKLKTMLTKVQYSKEEMNSVKNIKKRNYFKQRYIAYVNDLYSIMSDFVKFKTHFIGISFSDSSINEFLSHALKNETVKADLDKRLEKLYSDLKARYRNVLPSKKLEL